MTKYGRIYIIRNTINNKVYIGQTISSINLRFRNHLSAAKNGGDYIIGKAIRKYGESNFYVELLEECLVEELNEREKYWISFFDSTANRNGYNMSVGGNAVKVQKKLNSDEIIELFNLGVPAFKIAKKLHVATSRITNLLKSNNIKYGIELQRVDKVTESMICDLYLDGYGTMDICRKLNKDKGTVRKILTRNNIKLRTKQETNKLRRNLLTSKKMPHESLTLNKDN